MKRTSLRYAATIAILLLVGLVVAAPPRFVEEFGGKVIGVTDGDTIKVLVDKDDGQGTARRNRRPRIQDRPTGEKPRKRWLNWLPGKP